jgi:hypothetical protein
MIGFPLTVVDFVHRSMMIFRKSCSCMSLLFLASFALPIDSNLKIFKPY